MKKQLNVKTSGFFQRELVSIKLKFRKTIWFIFGKPDIPPRDFKINLKSYNTLPRYIKLTNLYLLNQDIETIAKTNNITRERVRQCVWKAYRDYEHENI